MFGAQSSQRSRDPFFEIVETEALLPANVTVHDAIRAVMSTLVNRLTAGEAYELLEALPASVRPLVETAVRERDGKPILRLGRAELLARVADELGVTPVHAEHLCAAVFSAARAELPPVIEEHVAGQLPRELSELWRTPPAALTQRWSPTGADARHELALDIENHAALPPGVSAGVAFSAVMCALADRLSGGEARDVLLSLPESIRPLVDRCMLHRDEPGIVFGRDGLVDRVAEHLAIDDDEAVPVIRAVFDAVRRLLPWKEVHDVASQLPPDLRDLWMG